MKTFIFIVIFFAGNLFFMSYKYINYQDDTWIVPDQFSNMENPYASDEDEDEIGKGLYNIHCRSCHGKKGEGDGSNASELETEVPNLTLDNIQSQPGGAIYFKVIMGKNEMPSFDKKIKSEEDRWLLVNYILSL